MNGLLISLLPLIIGSALVPIQIVITVLLLRAPGGRATTLAWVAGMSTVRVIQGIVFGIVLGSAGASSEGEGGPGLIASVLLLMVGIVFYISAAKQLMNHPDEDAPPPRWMATFEHVAPSRAFVMGAGLVLVSAKFWTFTLGAIAVIWEADPGDGAAIAWYAAFVILAMSVHLGLLAVAFVAPARSDALLDRVNRGLTAYSRPIMITLGLVFGTLFMSKALDGLGIL